MPVREATAIKLDGELTDEVWSRAPKIDGFVQRDPKEGAPPTYPTEARVAYDAQHLYVAVLAHDPEPDKIVGFLTRRDTLLAIRLGRGRRSIPTTTSGPPTSSRSTPPGVKQDRYYFNDGDEDQGGTRSGTSSCARATAGAPSSAFRSRSCASRRRTKPTFGFAVIAQIARLNETSTWPLIAKSTNGIVSQFGELHGLELTRSPKRLELLPYTVGELSTQPEDGNPLIKASILARRSAST